MSEAESAERARQEQDLERIIERISTEHGFDIRGYKRSTLYRRIRKRMSDAGAGGLEDYLVRLETDGHEHEELINTILINVTEFFRDPEAWKFLESECLEPLVRRRAAGEPIRAWSVGCASGEEAYSIAICLADLLGDRGLPGLKIYATDLDEGALAVARLGVYAADDLRNVTPEQLDRYFEEVPSSRFKIRRELRSAVIFGRHNVIVDAPISRLDLLVCRNLLIYFDSEPQRQLLARFHYALRDDGHLFLGKAETLMTRSLLFRPVEPRFRIFQRVPRQGGAETLLSGTEPRRAADDGAGPPEAPDQHYLLHALVGQRVEPLVLLDPGARIVVANDPARQLFHIPDSAIGRSFLEVDERVRPTSLRLAIEEVRATGRPSRVEDLALVMPDGQGVRVAVDVRPVLDPRGSLVQIAVWARDQTQEYQLTEEVAQVRQELETTSEELHTTNEELETTNEELQSTNEELETSNEELQSTNEELETTIEELQSTNEELETANDELRARQDDLNTLSRYQEVVLASLQMGLIVVDRDFKVTSWNRRSEETWGVREDEARRADLFSLDTGLPLATLREPLHRLMCGESAQETAELDATNRRGRAIRCQVRIQPLLDPLGAVAGAAIMIEDTATHS